MNVPNQCNSRNICFQHFFINTYNRQGLIFFDENTLIESTGLYEKSTIHAINIEDMTVIKETKLENKYFGEGCEIIEIDGALEVFQLTWTQKKM